MPAPAHYRVTGTGILGTDAAPFDEFSFGISLSKQGEPFLIREDTATLAETLYPRFATLVGALCTSQVRLDRVRVTSVNADGLTAVNVDGAYIQGDSVSTGARGTGTENRPGQIALAVTLQSAADGPTGRGRFFVPIPSAVMNSGGRVSSAAVGTIADAVKTFIDGVNTDVAALTTSEVVVASGGSPARSIPPALRPVTSILVGDVLDTQRRRRNAMVEAYTERALA